MASTKVPQKSRAIKPLPTDDARSPLIVVDGIDEAITIQFLIPTARVVDTEALATADDERVQQWAEDIEVLIVLPDDPGPKRIDRARAAYGRVQGIAESVQVGAPEAGMPFYPPDDLDTPDSRLAWFLGFPEFDLQPSRVESNGNLLANGNHVAEVPTAADLGIVHARDVKSRRIEWLWPYRLARRSMALVAGDGGIGKSQVLLSIGARVTTGGDWPDGSGKAPLGSVAILSAEDRPDDTINPRLDALEADINKVFYLQAKHTVRREGKEPTVHFMSFQDIGYWRDVFDNIPDCKLLIVDPLPSYLGRGVNDSKNSEIRAVLEPFIREIIEHYDICMLCNSHLNKSVDAKTPMHRILGSVAYGNLARNVHLVTRDPDDPTRRFLAQAKCNNAPDDLPSLAFRVERREVEIAGGEMAETAIPVFESDPVSVNLQEIVNGKARGEGGKRGPSPEKSARFAEWLWGRLQAGPVPIADLIDDAREEGLLAEKTKQEPKPSLTPLYNAKKRIPKLYPGFEVEQFEAERGEGSRPLQHWRLDPAPCMDGDGGMAVRDGIPF